MLEPRRADPREMMGYVRWIGLLLVLSLAPGCFAFEEMDEGMARWSRNSEPTASREEPDTPLPVTTRRQRSGWDRVRSLGSEPTSRDIVRCLLDGRSQYMRQSECTTRGGRVTSS